MLDLSHRGGGGERAEGAIHSAFLTTPVKLSVSYFADTTYVQSWPMKGHFTHPLKVTLLVFALVS